MNVGTFNAMSEQDLSYWNCSIHEVVTPATGFTALAYANKTTNGAYILARGDLFVTSCADSSFSPLCTLYAVMARLQIPSCCSRPLHDCAVADGRA